MTNPNFQKPTTPATSTNDYVYPEFRATNTAQPNTTGTQPTPPYFHGQEFDGYRYDATIHQWVYINPDETIAGKTEKPSKKMLIGAGIATAGFLLLGVVIGNAVAGDPEPTTTTVQSAPVSKDQRYLDALRTEINIVPVTTDTYLIQTATQICNGYDDGLTRSSMAQELYLGNDVSRTQAGQWVDIASRIFCPEYN